MTNFPKSISQPARVTQLQAELPVPETAPGAAQATVGVKAGLLGNPASLTRMLPLSTTQRDFLARFEASRSSRAGARERRDLSTAFAQGVLTGAAPAAKQRDARPFPKIKD